MRNIVIVHLSYGIFIDIDILLIYPLKNLEHPDKKLNSLGIILIP